jgi:hypothetical protein
MSRLLLALDAGAGVDAAGLAAAWNANAGTATVGAARVDSAGQAGLFPGLVELVVVPLSVNLASSAAYDLLKGLLKKLRKDEDQDLTQATTGDGDLVIVIRASHPDGNP